MLRKDSNSTNSLQNWIIKGIKMILTNVIKAKIHKAVITKKMLDYNGSIGIDKALLRASGMIPGERVQVLNFQNGARLETYIIEEKENSGIIALYGPAAKRGEIGNELCIISYALITSDEILNFKSKVVFVDKNNKIIMH